MEKSLLRRRLGNASTYCRVCSPKSERLVIRHQAMCAHSNLLLGVCMCVRECLWVSVSWWLSNSISSLGLSLNSRLLYAATPGRILVAVQRQLTCNMCRTSPVVLPSSTWPPTPFHFMATPSCPLHRPQNHMSILSLLSLGVPVYLQNTSPVGPLLSTSLGLSRYYLLPGLFR